MDGWRCYFCRGLRPQDILISEFHNSLCFLFIYYLLLLLLLLLFWETALYLFDVCVLFYFTFFFIGNVFFLFISWTRSRYLYNFFLSDNLWLEHHFYIFYYTPITYNRNPTNISFYTDIQSERDHKNLI